VDGVDGADGTDGVEGTDGVDGTAGVDGTDGVEGTAGVEGTGGSSAGGWRSGVDGTVGACTPPIPSALPPAPVSASTTTPAASAPRAASLCLPCVVFKSLFRRP
jgi:hypothetical protein